MSRLDLIKELCEVRKQQDNEALDLNDDVVVPSEYQHTFEQGEYDD